MYLRDHQGNALPEPEVYFATAGRGACTDYLESTYHLQLHGQRIGATCLATMRQAWWRKKAPPSCGMIEKKDFAQPSDHKKLVNEAKRWMAIVREMSIRKRVRKYMMEKGPDRYFLLSDLQEVATRRLALLAKNMKPRLEIGKTNIFVMDGGILSSLFVLHSYKLVDLLIR